MAETTTGTETTQVGADTGAGKTAEAAGDTGKTVLSGDAEAGKTAEGAEAGAKGADAGAEGDKSKEGEAGDKSDKGDKKPGESDDDKKAEGPPEKYEFTMPDGVELDTVLLEKAEPVLRELGLSNEQANKLASLIAEQRVSEAQQQSDAYAQQVEDWGKAARDDAEYGGAKFDQNVPLALKAIGQFGTPELKALLADGLGNHPEVIRFCVRVGKAMGEDSGVDSSNKTPPEKSASATLFDHPTSQPKR